MANYRILSSLLKYGAFALLILANGYILEYILRLGQEANSKEACLPDSTTSKATNPTMHFGFEPDNFAISWTKMNSGETIGKLLGKYSIPSEKIDKIVANVSQIFSPTKFNTANKLAFVSTNPCEHPDYFCYEVSPSQYLVCELRGDHCVRLVDRQVSHKRETAVGYIESNLWSALVSQDISINLIDQMEDALASAVDFLHVQKGNTYKLIFDRIYVDGVKTDRGELIAAYFDTGFGDHYSIKYTVNSNEGYYDLKGAPMKSQFLKAPLRFSRISSGFTMNRFHPVLKYSRPHLGTDYAAPYGTPVMAVGSGVVEAAAYSGGNGNFVKIRHDKTYQTQYLHLSKFASGIFRGASVSQGQIIGYVGSTGLATGPHVCFRFWKDGRQVDHRRLHFPSPEPLPANLLPDFFEKRDQLVKELDGLESKTAYQRSKAS